KKGATTRKHSPTPSPTSGVTGKKKSSSAKKTEGTEQSPTPSSSASPQEKEEISSAPEPGEIPAGSPTASATASSAKPTRGAPNASLSPDEIKGFDNYPLEVQQLLKLGLDLTTRSLDYKYGSADPANGGMDCSGFVYFVLRQSGISDVPRASSGQYVW